MRTWVAGLLPLMWWACPACHDAGRRLQVDGGIEAGSIDSVDSTPDRSAGDRAAIDGAAAPDGSAADLGIGAVPDGWNPANRPTCNGRLYACSDGLDNDGDGLTDARDAECTGPCDNDEASFGLSIPGIDPAICEQDCFWDGDAGFANDDCEWTLKCDPKNPGLQAFPGPCPYDEQFVDQGNCPSGQTKACRDFCTPLAPNGCDCFGCCELYTPAGKYPETVFLYSGGGCTANTPQGCAPCTQVADCLNTCDDCELCLGKDLAHLPTQCGGTGVTIEAIACSPNDAPCLDNSFCPDDYFCLTGCCKRWSW